MRSFLDDLDVLLLEMDLSEGLGLGFLSEVLR